MRASRPAGTRGDRRAAGSRLALGSEGRGPAAGFVGD